MKNFEVIKIEKLHNLKTGKILEIEKIEKI